MLKFFERNEAHAEPIEDFQRRVNSYMAECRAARLAPQFMNIPSMPGITLCIGEEKVQGTHPQTGQVIRAFEDLSEEEVEKRLTEARNRPARPGLRLQGN